VGDYGAAVNAKLIVDHGFDAELWTPKSSHSGSSKSAELRAALCDADAAVLEYSLYSYQRYGIPHWMVGALADWKSGAKRLVTVFHEIYANGMPWSTAFWTSPPQRYVSRRIATLSDGMITTTERHGRILRNWAPQRKIVVLPVPSNIGEPSALSPHRENAIAVFGLSGSRGRAYWNQAEKWAAVRRALGNVTLHDIGPPVNLPLTELTGLPCVVHGQVTTAEASSILSAVRWGVLDYHNSTLQKSGVFAAYCAHGLAPIVFRHSTPPGTGIEKGREFAVVSTGGLQPADAAEISQNAYRWYGDHALKEHTEAIHQLLRLR
jgi:hypothetical protein